MPSVFDTNITYLKGVGPRKAELLAKEFNIRTYGDLLYHFPFRYIDKSRIYKISEVNSDKTYFLLKGKVSNMKAVGDKRTRYVSFLLTDDTGSMELLWFRGLQWIKKRFDPQKEYLIFGKPSVFKNRFNMVHPEVEEATPENTMVTGNRLEGVYHTTEKLKTAGLGSRGFSRIIQTLLKETVSSIQENLPPYLQEKYQMIGHAEALVNIHFPKNTTLLEKAVQRLKFEELFFLQMELLLQKKIQKEKTAGHVFKNVGEIFNTFYHQHLPFTLTGAQKRVIREIRNDMKSGKQMNRLLQGDVGSGKTLVALMSMLIAIDNGYQTAFMAPTEILATQHYNTLKKLLGKMNIPVGLLTGSTKAKQRKEIHQALQNHELPILVGTHALIEDTVKFSNLGFVVIDEQHRFGVAQRAKLWKKNTIPPHVLVMTATPIPRTLAMTLYGNLDVSIIDEMPPGRKPVKTLHFFESKRLRVIGFMREQIKKGRQIYVVYPLIKESENLDLKNLIDGYENIVREFPEPEYHVSVVHGKMKAEDKEFEMQRFKKGETHIMVSTTVIEVGVDVPNASVMVIENAERFGLSQLHQLRGRVGRGADQSWCILMSGNKLSNEGRKRLETMVRTNDGFEIAEADLKLRGPGDIQGTRQSGMLDFHIANLAKDGVLIARTRKIAAAILTEDPQLQKPENFLLNREMKKRFKGKTIWARIS
ncbi:ATP-dependent DNA helicase RecG [Candidatus Sulfidibacterium hydrothermale]|uniref:ATP-dependent DNA helicase RecG n=1 Tax=Candidatus Sulfidibacterium hydrothermale TaxID=2875962 RepID=UPI001F0B0574|nr:ATP-dependent DNA helicase RecG [Candidatus Sulfidibacterium hydrothermale]UBM62318.1 ATP-dependent DNA helicase RecG [Candidatus Sulfidibacterium hydrothermale]